MSIRLQIDEIIGMETEILYHDVQEIPEQLTRNQTIRYLLALAQEHFADEKI